MAMMMQGTRNSVQQHDMQGIHTLSTQVYSENDPQRADEFELAAIEYKAELDLLAPGAGAGTYAERYTGPGVAPAAGAGPGAANPRGINGCLVVVPRAKNASEGYEMLPVCLVCLGGASSVEPHPKIVSDVRLLGKTVDLGGFPDYNWFEWHPTRYNMYTANVGLRRNELQAGQEDRAFRVRAAGVLTTPYVTHAARGTTSGLVYQQALKLPTISIRGKTPVLNNNHEGIPAYVPLWLDYPTDAEIQHLKMGRYDPMARRDLLGEAARRPLPFLPWVPVTQDQYVRRHGRASGLMPAVVHDYMYFGFNLRDAAPYEALQVLVGKPVGPAGLVSA